MDSREAREVLAGQLARKRARGYPELTELVGEESRERLTGPSGVEYQLRVRVMWNDEPQGALRLVGSIDDGGIRAFAPLVESLVLQPDGALVEERERNGWTLAKAGRGSLRSWQQRSAGVIGS